MIELRVVHFSYAVHFYFPKKIYHRNNHGSIATTMMYEIAPDIIKIACKRFFIFSIFMCIYSVIVNARINRK